MKLRHQAALISAIAIGTLPWLASPAYAAASLTFTPSTVAAGGTVTINATCTGTLNYLATPNPLPEAAQQLGSQTYTVPADAPLGKIEFQLFCQGPDERAFTELEIVAPTPTPSPTPSPVGPSSPAPVPSGAANTGGGGAAARSTVIGVTALGFAGLAGIGLILVRRRTHA